MNETEFKNLSQQKAKTYLYKATELYTKNSHTDRNYWAFNQIAEALRAIGGYQISSEDKSDASMGTGRRTRKEKFWFIPHKEDKGFTFFITISFVGKLDDPEDRYEVNAYVSGYGKQDTTAQAFSVLNKIGATKLANRIRTILAGNIQIPCICGDCGNLNQLNVPADLQKFHDDTYKECSKCGRELNIIDACEGAYVFASTYHEGQNSDLYRLTGEILNAGFRPRPSASSDNLTDNALETYEHLKEKYAKSTVGLRKQSRDNLLKTIFAEETCRICKREVAKPHIPGDKEHTSGPLKNGVCYYCRCDGWSGSKHCNSCGNSFDGPAWHCEKCDDYFHRDENKPDPSHNACKPFRWDMGSDSHIEVCNGKLEKIKI